MKTLKYYRKFKESVEPFSNEVGIFLKDKKTGENVCLVRWINVRKECLNCKWYGFSCAGYTEKSKEYMICSGIKD